MGLKARWALLIGCLTVFTQISSFASGSVVLAWDASPDASVTGYRVYYGVASGDYTNSAVVGNVTTATFANLVEGVTYYFSATAYDSSGVESPFSNETSYSVPVAGANLPPTLNALSAVSISEDAISQSVTLAGISDGETIQSQTLTVTATSSNPSLIPNPTVSYTSPNTTGSLSFVPVVNASGSATITVTVNDGQSANNTISRTFVVTVTAVNDVPTLGAINNVTVNEDVTAQTVSLSGIGSGAANESQTITVTATSSNPSLIPNPTVSYTSPSATGSLSFTPVANANGTATITVTVNDGQAANNLVSQTFTITVNPVNDAPTLNALSAVNVSENASAQTVSLAGIGTGAANETQTLTVTATSSNPSLIPNPTVSYTSPNATGSLSFTPAADANGSATITVTVNDGQAANNTIVRTFTVTVSPVNNPPTLGAISAVTINEDASAQTVSLAGIGTGAVNETQTLTITATSSNPSLIPNPTVSYTSPSATGSLSFTPVANANGTATITVTVNDGQALNNTVSQTFLVTVNAVNDAPTLNALGNLTINEGAAAQTVSLAGIGTGAANETQTLTVTATSSNPSLIPNPTVSYTSPNATGSLSFAPVANANGTAMITVTVDDGQAANNVTSRTFTVTVNPVNNAPTLDTISAVTVNEDAGAQTVGLTGIGTGAPDETQTLTITATSSNPSLIPNPTVTYTSPNATGTLNFASVTNANGSAIITVTVNDGQSANSTVSRTFTVTVNAVNDAPTINAINNVGINENSAAQTVSLSGIGTGAANESQTLTISATSSNPSLIPNPTVSYTSPSATGSLSFTPVANANGTATITVTVNDGQAVNNITTQTFVVSVGPVNNQPTLAAISNITIAEDAATQLVNLSGISSGATNEADTLTVTATSSNPSLIPNPTVTYSSPDATGSLSLTPVANGNGSAVITVTVNDGQIANNTFSRTFTVTVTAGNDAPTLAPISNVTINEDAGAQSVSLSGIGTGAANETQTLTITATSSNPSLIPNPTATYTSPNATGSLNFTPVANANGTATITVTVNDGQTTNNTVVQTFLVTVNPVNDAPTLTAISNVGITENAAAQTVNLTGIGSGAANESQTLTITATSSNPSLIPNPTVNYTSPNATGSLSFTPVTDANGSATITVTVDDGQAANNTFTRTFVVSVSSVNNQPTLDAISAVTINEDASAQSVSLTGIGTGAANETQTLTVTATSSSPSLIPNPTVTYTSPNATGSLSFTPVANATGSATITVTVNDGQAVSNTVSRTFVVTVSPVNDAPTLNAINGLTIAENVGAQTVGLSGIGTGAANEIQTLTITATSSDPSLIPNPTVTYTSPNATGSLRFTPVANANGSATITVTVNDGQAANNTTTRSFVVTVTAVNSAPTITAIPNKSIISDTNSGPLSFTIGDVETAAAGLTLTASSSAPAVVQATNIVFGGSDANRTVTVTPTPGSSGIADLTLTVSDGAASASTTFRVTVSAPAGQLSVSKSGSGTVSPDLSSTVMVVGQSYTVTATPAAGYTFAGWSGGVVSSSATITFTMTANLTLQANFVPNPYTTAAATYNGLFNEADEVRLNSAGSFNVYVDGNGNFSAWVQNGYSRYQFSGKLDTNLRATNIVTRWDSTPLTVELLVGQGASAGQISGRVTDGVWTSPLSGGRALASSPFAGEYTVVIPGTANNPALPAGDGYATLHVGADGLGTMSGTLADGTPFAQTAYVTADGDWPLYVSMYVGKGAVMSWLTFTNLSSSDVSGNVVWLKQAGASATSYPAGFTVGTKAVGSVYTAPEATGKAVNLAGAVVTFSGGNLSSTFNNVVSVNAGSQVVNLSPNALTFNLNPALGSFTGQVTESGSGQAHAFSGVVLQKQNAGYGTMTGTSLGSRVVLAAP